VNEFALLDVENDAAAAFAVSGKFDFMLEYVLKPAGDLLRDLIPGRRRYVVDAIKETLIAGA